jgi:phage terminase large subunit-like protein
LLLNQRVSLESTWIGPTLWKENASDPDYSLLNSKPLHIGLDLSKTDDLTAAVGAIFDDEGFVHVYPWVFTPVATVDARAKRDRAPYVEWIKQGLMVGVPGKTIDYEWVAQFMAQELNSAKICSINFDRWRIEELKRISDNVGFGNDANWIEVGQGYQSFSPRLEKVMELLLQGKIKHGGHPLLNFGAANAIAVADPAGNLKLDKAKSTQKIDMIVAMVMAVYAAFSYEDQAVDVDSWIV